LAKIGAAEGLILDEVSGEGGGGFHTGRTS
jgi:hypothetical protein